MFISLGLMESFNGDPDNLDALEFWRGEQKDILDNEASLAWMHPHRQHFSSSPFAKRTQSSLQDSMGMTASGI